MDLILNNLTSHDLRHCRLVNWSWSHIINRLILHREGGRLGWGWREGEPQLDRLQCSKERSVVTVTALDCDEDNIAAGLGSCGKVELWSRSSCSKNWSVLAHNEGVYCVTLGRVESLSLVISGGEDNTVKLWSRDSGECLKTLDHHTYIVWSVRVSVDHLVTASYDCTVAWVKIGEDADCDIVDTVQGPWSWADALFIDDQGKNIVVQDEDIFVLTVWDVKQVKELARLEGHTDEVNCVELRGNLLVSGGCDSVVRLWDWSRGQCLASLSGHGGKVWSVSCDNWRIVSGGRGGEVRLWSLGDAAQRLVRGEHVTEDDEDKYDEGRVLFAHPRSSSVASIQVDRFGLVSGDGLAMLIQWDFWSSQSKKQCPCKTFTTPVPDPLEHIMDVRFLNVG